MVHWLGLSLLLLAGFYGGRMLRYARGWSRVVNRTPAAVPDPPPIVSVVIAARNESQGIERCLRSIAENDYPAERFEIVVVDDCSDDDTAEVVIRFVHRMEKDPTERPDVRLLRAENNETRRSAHKKSAIDQGVRASRGDVILFTDADVEVPVAWVRTMTAQFDPTADMVAGPVVYHPANSTFDRIQALEFMGWVAIGAGSIGAGRPELCNGANLAVRRRAYEAAGGVNPESGVTSGDDVLLMVTIEARNPGSVRFCPSRDALVRTAPNPNLSAFLAQRIRWASKATSYPHRAVVASQFAMVALDTLLVLTVPLILLFPLLGPYALAAWLMKAFSVHRLVAPVSRHLGVQLRPRTFWAVLFLQPLYLAFAGLAGMSTGYIWKGRRIRR